MRLNPSVLLGCLIGLAAGCSNHQASLGSPAATATATATATVDEDAEEVNHYPPCEKLSVAAVQPFFNTPIKMTPDPPSTAPSQRCTFTTLDGIQSIDITTVVGPTVKLMWPAEKPPTDDGKPGIPLTGIGDSAVRESADIWVYAMKGGVFCMIHGDHAGENAQGSVEEIRGLKRADSIGHTIPAATAQAVAQNLGTLCNRIWGSGNTQPNFAATP